MFHHFHHDISGISLPERFTFPFCYVPHQLSVLAARELQESLAARADWHDDIQSGKMFGVLVAQNEKGEVGYITAFSGLLAGRNVQPGFAPPVYDLQNPDGFFQDEEKEISEINHRIEALSNSMEYKKAVNALECLLKQAQNEVDSFKAEMMAAKKERDRLRSSGSLSAEDERRLVLESQHQKAELKRIQSRWKKVIEESESMKSGFDAEIESLKQERKQRSAALQERLFSQFRFLNILGEHRDLLSIFDEAIGALPPAGAGECAAPRMLQYAFLNNLKPLCMAEFWWGDSPKTEIRHHLHFYPSCKGKCKPILMHMLKGMDIDPNPLQTESLSGELKIIYEDEWIVVVDKPAGMLAVQGKVDLESVENILRAKYPEVKGPMVMHRLDQATSGIMVLAKEKEAHKCLQKQFADRTVKKRYVAILDGIIAEDSGTISLPICPDPDDRPRQIVSEEYGKTAITSYKVIERIDGCTRIAFFPHTGRTHQLRVHSSHSSGLNTPIKGDYLYGQPADRLYLHAESISFIHPGTGTHVRFTAPAPF